MKISLVVAAATNYAIGKEGSMPWHLPADLRHFKNVTWGLPVVMGRKTYESLGKPLPGRTNIVITRQEASAFASAEVQVAKDPDQALAMAALCKVKEVMIIGGGEIYRLFWERAQRIYLSKVEVSPEADTFFPSIDPAQWKLVQQLDREADVKNAFNLSFQIWERHS
jgi:dihydrofolate reductase